MGVFQRLALLQGEDSSTDMHEIYIYIYIVYEIYHTIYGGTFMKCMIVNNLCFFTIFVFSKTEPASISQGKHYRITRRGLVKYQRINSDDGDLL